MVGTMLSIRILRGGYEDSLRNGEERFSSFSIRHSRYYRRAVRSMHVLYGNVFGLAWLALALVSAAQRSIPTSEDDYNYSPRITVVTTEPWLPRTPHVPTVGTTTREVLTMPTTRKLAEDSLRTEVRRRNITGKVGRQQFQKLPSTAKPPPVKSKFLSAMLKHIFNLENDVRALRSETAQRLERIEEALSTVNAKVREEPWTKALAKMTRRTFRQYWNVDNFRGHISRANATPTSIKSDTFVIGGYTAKLQVSLENIDGDMWLGIYFHLCPGPKDSLLQWPFNSPFALSLVHPMFPRKNLLHVATPRSFAEGGSAFHKRPKRSCGAGHGIQKFHTLKAIEREGFVFDNAVTVSVTLYRLVNMRTV